jgi:hypothetical protein
VWIMLFHAGMDAPWNDLEPFEEVLDGMRYRQTGRDVCLGGLLEFHVTDGSFVEGQGSLGVRAVYLITSSCHV